MNSPTITISSDDAGRDDPRDGGVHESRAGQGQPVDKRSDVWAFGAVLYEMLTGRRAFTGRRLRHAGARADEGAGLDDAAGGHSRAAPKTVAALPREGSEATP